MIHGIISGPIMFGVTLVCQYLRIKSHIKYRFGPEATHTKEQDLFSNIETEEISFPLVHPKDIEPNKDADGVFVVKNRNDYKRIYLKKRH